MKIVRWMAFALITVFLLRGVLLHAQTDSVHTWIAQSQEAFKKDKLNESLFLAQKAFNYAQSQKNDANIGNAALQLSEIYRVNDSLKKAEETALIAVGIYEKTGLLERQVRSLSILARVKQDQRNFGEASALYTKALTFYNQITSAVEAEKYLDLKGFILERMAVILTRQKAFDKAEAYALEAYKIFEKLNDTGQLEITCTALGNIYLWLEKYPKASLYHQKAFELSKSLSRNTGRNLNNLGIIASKSGRFDEGIKYYLQAIEQYEKLGNKELIAQAQINIGESYHDKGNYPKAIEFTKQGTEGLLAIKKVNGLVQGYEMLVSAFIKSGDAKNALDYQKRFIDLKDTLSLQSREKVMMEWQTKFETEKKDKEIQILNQENTVQSKNNELLRGAIVALLFFGFLGWQFYRYRQKIKQEREHIAKVRAEEAAERHWQETELRALRSQMNPHFIFNCLNSIKSLTLKNETDKASLYITKFSRLMRQVLENSRSEWISLHQEIETLSLYMDMEKLRFQSKFDYQLDISPDLSPHSIQVPPMVIQPYVENAIWHGLMHKEGNGKVVVSLSEKDNKQLIIKVIDNGIGRKRSSELKSKSATEKKSFGLQITSERMDMLNQYYHINASTMIKDLYDDLGNPLGTEVQLIIPL